MSLSDRFFKVSKYLPPLGATLLFPGLVAFLWATMQPAEAALPVQSDSISFQGSSLSGETLHNPTSLQFGPDGRLYVAQENGLIYAYQITRHGVGNYEIVDTELINLIHDIPNHNDQGLPVALDGRKVLGLYVTGTSTAPELYVTSSDPRGTPPATGMDLGIDTNSGVLSHLRWNNSTDNWEKIDLVRGLPRSEYNHASNGIILDEATNTLYVAQGANTNAGAPGHLMAFLSEYALSAAILSVDLDAILALPTQSDANGDLYKYNLPTLEDPSGSAQPWGGKDGRNQALLVPGGPVQVHSPGYRNPYDLVMTEAGHLYTVDNGANPGWGGFPENEGPPTGTPPTADCTNRYLPGEIGVVNNLNGLHLIDAPGYYGGHPNPTRGNPAGAGLHVGGNPGMFVLNPTANWPPVPMGLANPIECDFLQPNAGPGTIDPDQALIAYDVSTNGITEYTATTFDGALQNNLLMVGFTVGGDVFRAVLNETGDAVVNGLEILADDVGRQPLDIIAQGDEDIFPGTIWIALHGADNITILDPLEADVLFLPVALDQE